MSVESFTPTSGAGNTVVTMTESAQRYFSKQLNNQQGQIIRFSTKVSGCTGFAYVLDYAAAAESNDLVIEINESISLAVDKSSLEALNGTVIDYVQEGINGLVKFHNPNVVDECGCGESFSVKSAV